MTDYHLWTESRSSWCGYEVAGAHHYLSDLTAMCPSGANLRAGVAIRRSVNLVTEPDNEFDPNAVAIVATGRIIGHLTREDAPLWGPVIRLIETAGFRAATDANIWFREVDDWLEDGDGELRSTTRLAVRVTIKLEPPTAHALPLNDPPTQPYSLVPRGGITQVSKNEEHFQETAAPLPEGGIGLVFVTLHRREAVNAKGVARSFAEVRLNGHRVGELTAGMSKRFLPMIDHLDSRGLTTACIGTVNCSTVAAKIRIDAAKADEVDRDFLDGPPVTLPRLWSTLGARMWPPTGRRLRLPDRWDQSAWTRE